MGQSHSRRNGSNQAPFPPNYPGAYRLPQSPFQPPPSPGPANRGQMYVNYPTQYPEQYQFGRYGPSPRQPVHPSQGGAAQKAELQQTKTIRNQVNLKKQTLKVVFRNKEKTNIMPTFTFDASAPCSVTLFFMATEDAGKGCKLTALVQPPGPRAMYQMGLGQVFPPPGDETSAEAYTLDLSLYEKDDLTRATGKDDTFPMVIRLETITEKGLKEGHSLDELEPGAPTPTWVQSQTTYSYFVKEEDGTWEARALKQKIWVDGISYELQEIYGIHDIYSGDKKAAEKSDPAPLTGGYSEDLDGRECVICLAAVCDTTVLPCRHMCMCESCARELQRQQVSRCPICRDAIESLLHIKRPNKKTGDKPEKSEDSMSSGTTGVVSGKSARTDEVKQ